MTKIVNITTKKGQSELLKAMIEIHNLGYEEDEKQSKIYNEGYIQALEDILGLSDERFTLNGIIFSNIKEDIER